MNKYFELIIIDERQLEELEAITLEQFKAAFDAVFFEKRANL